MALQRLKWKPNKTIHKQLCSVVGIGTHTAVQLCSLVGIGKYTLSSQVDSTILEYLKERVKRTLLTDKKLRSNVKYNIDIHKEIGTYKGIRHTKHLPTRGQST